jgi:hypothetical protein
MPPEQAVLPPALVLLPPTQTVALWGTNTFAACNHDDPTVVEVATLTGVQTVQHLALLDSSTA